MLLRQKKQKLAEEAKVNKEEDDEDVMTIKTESEIINDDTSNSEKTPLQPFLSQEDIIQNVVETFCCATSCRPSNINGLLAARDENLYANLNEENEEEEDDGNKEPHMKANDIESTLTKASPASEDHHPPIDEKIEENEVDRRGGGRENSSEDIDGEITFTNFEGNFEDSLWEIELTEPVVRWFKKNRRKNLKLCRNVVQRLKTLANGYWNERNRKKLTGPKIALYEANLSSGQRILWEVAVNLSERLNQFQDTSTNTASTTARTSPLSSGTKHEAVLGTIHAEMIRVWAIVEDHDNLKREIEKVEKSHQRGRECLIQSQLIPTTSNAEKVTDKDGVTQTVPKTFSTMPEEVIRHDDNPNVALSNNRHYHLGSSNPNEYNLLKFYSFNSHMLGCLFGGKDRSDTSLPFKMTSKEYEVARLNPAKPCGILLMGRSGTGKTSVQCYRLAFDWVDYWRNVIDMEPLLRSRPIVSSTTQDEPKNEQLVSYSHLKQVFVTKSMCLRTEVQRVARDLMRGGRVDGPIAQVNGVDELDNFSNIPEDRYPLFSTLSEFLHLLDTTLQGDHFVTQVSNNQISSELSGLAAYFDVDDDDDDDIEDRIDETNKDFNDFDNSELDTSGIHRERSAQQELTWIVFLNNVWPKLPKRGIDGVDASLLWTEINSNLKGSVGALKILARYNTSSLFDDRLKALKEEYDAGGKKQSAIPIERREHIWNLFIKYEQFRIKHYLFDQNDLVANIYRRLLDYGTNEVFFHRLYIDEVQDFTMAELYLILQFTDPNFSFLAGDTAQTIARGIGFRFSDLRSLFKQMNDEVEVHSIRTPSPYSLTTSYRSHTGVLKLASSVVEVLYKYFPRAIDNLGLDRGLFEGPKPKILLVDDVAELTVMLLGSQGNNTGRIDFGDEQVILVRDDEARKKLPPSLAESSIVLTIFESKGLEFNTVLLWNFFSDSSASKEWRVLHSYFDNIDDAVSASPPINSENNGIRMESFESMEGGGGKNRPLEFEEGKYTILESELKALYCALTRARINIWIVDFDKEKRKPAFRWFIDGGLAHVITKETSATLSTVGHSDKTSAVSFQKRGLHFLSIAFAHEKPEGLLEAAATCFRKAGANDLFEFVKARLAYHQAMESYHDFTKNKVKKLSARIDYEMLEAAKLCLQSEGTSTLTKLAAKLLSKTKRYELSGLLYSSLDTLFGSRKAAEEYDKANHSNNQQKTHARVRRGEELCKVVERVHDQINTLTSGNINNINLESQVKVQFDRLTKLRDHYLFLAIKHFKSNLQYGDAIELLERLNIKPTDELTKLQLKTTIKMVTNLDLKLNPNSLYEVVIPNKLRKELDRIPIEGAIDMLLSDGGTGCLEIAAVLLVENQRQDEAASLLKRHYSYRHAATVYLDVKDIPNQLSCLVLDAIDALSASFTFPVSSIYSRDGLQTQMSPTFKNCIALHHNSLKLSNGYSLPAPSGFGWLQTVGFSLEVMISGTQESVRKVLTGLQQLNNDASLFNDEYSLFHFSFVFDRWLLLDNSVDIMQGEVLQEMLQTHVPPVIELLSSMVYTLNSNTYQSLLSDEMAIYYGIDTLTDDPEMVELGKRNGSRLVMNLFEEFGIQTIPSLTRSGNVQVRKVEVIVMLSVHLLRAVLKFCLNVMTHSNGMQKIDITKKKFSMDNILYLVTANLIHELLPLYESLNQNRVFGVCTLSSSILKHDEFEYFARLSKLSLEATQSFGMSLVEFDSNAFNVMDDYVYSCSKELFSSITLKASKLIMKKWIEKYFSNRKVANSASQIIKLWNCCELVNRIENLKYESGVDVGEAIFKKSCWFNQTVIEINDKDKKWNNKRKSNFYHQNLGYSLNSIIYSNHFIQAISNVNGEYVTIYPEEFGLIIETSKRLQNGKFSDIYVAFESGHHIYCPIMQVKKPPPIIQQFNYFLKCLHGEFGNEMNTSSAVRILVRLIRNMCFTQQQNHSTNLTCLGNIDGSNNLAVIYLLELAVTLILGMIAASSSTSASSSSNFSKSSSTSGTKKTPNKIYLPHFFVQKHLHSKWDHFNVNTDNEKTKDKNSLMNDHGNTDILSHNNKKKKSKRKRTRNIGSGTWGVALKAFKSIPSNTKETENILNLSDNLTKNNQISNLNVLKEMTEQCHSSKSTKAASSSSSIEVISKDLSLALKSLIHFIITRITQMYSIDSILSEQQKEESRKPLYILLLTLLTNLPTCSKLLNNINGVINKLCTCIDLLEMVSGTPEYWTSTRDAGIALDFVLKEATSDKTTQQTTQETHEKNNNEDMDCNKNSVLWTCLFVNEDTLNNHQLSLISKEVITYSSIKHHSIIPIYYSSEVSRDDHQDSDIVNSVEINGVVDMSTTTLEGTDIDSVIQQDEENDKALSEQRLAATTISMWWRKLGSSVRTTKGQNKTLEDTKKEVLKSLQMELDNILSNDEFHCKLCNVVLKANSVDEHVALIESKMSRPIQPPQFPTFQDAGIIRYHDKYIQCAHYSLEKNQPSSFRLINIKGKSIHNKTFYADPAHFHYDPEPLNLNYYNELLRFYKAQCDLSLHKYQIAHEQVIQTQQLGIDDDDIAKPIEMTSYREYNYWLQNSESCLEFAGNCLSKYHKIHDTQHLKLIEKLNNFQETTESRSLNIIVDAILLSREIPQCLRNLASLSDSSLSSSGSTNNQHFEDSENENLKHEIEILSGSLSDLIKQSKDFLINARQKKTFMNQSVVNMIDKKLNSLSRVSDELKTLLKTTKPNYGSKEGSSESETQFQKKNNENVDVSDDERDNYGDDVDDDDGGNSDDLNYLDHDDFTVLPSKKQQQKIKKKARKKKKKSSSTNNTNPVYRRGGLAASKHVIS